MKEHNGHLSDITDIFRTFIGHQIDTTGCETYYATLKAQKPQERRKGGIKL